MLRNYRSKSKHHSWSKDDVDKAITAVDSEEMGYTEHAQLYNVPRSTLFRKYIKQVPVN